MKTIALLLLWISICWGATAQNPIGLPEVVNYTKKAYSAGTQNWDIKQGYNGLVYFANNEGLLSFDGTYWKLYPLPNKTIVRSLEIGKDNRIYVGGQDEIGYFSPDQSGSLVYTSLKKLIPDSDKMFTDVWDIVAYENSVFFRSGQKIFQYNAGKVAVYKSTEWLFLGLSNGQLIAQDVNKGILRFQNGVWVPFAKEGSLSGNFLATAFLPLTKDSSLLTTLKSGVYVVHHNQISPLQSPSLQAIANKQIYAASLLDDDRILLGTGLDGCFIIDEKGNLVQKLSRPEGLQSNNIHTAFVDKAKNLWLALDNGIDFITYNNAIKHLIPDPQNGSSGYASLIHNNELYIGTSNGLYKAPLSGTSDLSFVKSSFQPVANSNGQVWNLSEVNGQLLMGHHDGAFIINKGTASLLDNSSGFWTFLPLDNVLPSAIMVAGTYNGISFYQYRQNGFTKSPQTAAFESARFVTIDNGTIWVSHPYKGIYKVQVNAAGAPTVKRYTQKNGLSSINNNYVFRVRNSIVAATENGILEYNPKTDAFETSEFFKTLFPNTAIRYLKEDPYGNIWFVFEKSLGVADLSGPRPKIVYVPELNNKMVSGFEHINFIDLNNVIVGGENGCYHINYDQYRQKRTELQVQIRNVKAIGKSDTLLFGGYFGEVNEMKTQQRIPELASSFNSFHLSFSASLYGQQSNTEYSYYLKGFDEHWSDWTNKTEKEYTYLPPGTYTFTVKARNNLGNESALATYTFTILPPWYRTWWAYFLYTLLVFVGAYLIHLRQKKKLADQQHQHQEEQKRLQALHQLELERNEKEIIKLKNEKLESEIEFKNSELASSAMHLVQRGEMLAGLKEELVRLIKKPENSKAADDLKKLLRTLGEDDKMDKDWEHFSQHFDKVHCDFLVVLKAKHTNLSPNELKLCAYLRMNLSSKEIAQLMNISVRGVEISRYRLRKKLQLPTEVNLFDFLLQVQSGNTATPAAEPAHEAVSIA